MAWKPLPETIEVTLETPKPQSYTLPAEKTCIVVVDMENHFCKRGNQRSFDVIEGNVRLLEKAREAGAKIIYVQSVRQIESPEHTVYQRPLHLLVGDWSSQIVDEIAPQPGDTVIQKWSHDIWAWYGLEEELAKEGLVAGETTVLVTGVSAAGCAHAASLGFSNRHYEVLIPMDCTAASIEAEARTYHQYMGGGYAYNMGFTLSTMVDFQPAVELAQPIEVAATV
jgi:nicotinamidase-related amidase